MSRRPPFVRSHLMMSVSASVLAMAGVAPAAAQSYIKTPRNPEAAAVRAATERATLSAAAMAAAERARAAFDRAAKVRAQIDAAQAAARAQAMLGQSAVPNGLTAGGLVVSTSTDAAKALWTGAEGPVETVADGKYDVTIKQTQERAILSWDSFNIGRETTLTFNQQGHADWVALNRVTAGADPSKILGKMKSDGTVLVINSNGVIFGGSAQINTRSLIASALDVGPARATFNVNGSQQTLATDIAWRNDNFLRNGLLGYDKRPDPNFPQEFLDYDMYAPFTTLNGALDTGPVTVEKGAVIEGGAGGMVLLTATQVTNAGRITSRQGQVILAAGNKLALTQSTGGEGDPRAAFGAAPDRNIRGLVAATQGGIQGSTQVYSVLNTADGVIEAYEGNISLIAPTALPRLRYGTTDQFDAFGFGFGSVRSDGVLSATTSVSRNGSMMLEATDIRIGAGSLLTITPDTGTETIPQNPSSMTAFKPSAITIGQLATKIGMETGSLLLAPGANVAIGRPVYDVGSVDPFQSIQIDSGAMINLAGMTDVMASGDLNQVVISPAKRNELRDSPLYREGFLNGATIYLDPRKSGVREDGVAWIGSPLIDAAAYYQLFGISAAQLMTKGGSLKLGTQNGRDFQGGPPTTNVNGSATSVIVKQGATIDVSGGWVTYQPGRVRETMLISSTGKVVPISEADPNETYVSVYNGFTADHARWSVRQTWTSPFLKDTHQVLGYTEGRDAGSIQLGGRAVVFDGTMKGEAFAGAEQIAGGHKGTAKSANPLDGRALQGAASELPSGGALIINALSDIAIESEVTPLGEGDYSGWYYGDNTVFPQIPARPLVPDDRYFTFRLSDDALAGSGFSGLTLNTFGAITLGDDASLTLAPGGVVDLRAGRRIEINGDITTPGGSILLATSGFITAPLTPPGTTPPPASSGIAVNGNLSVAGLWVNDFERSAETMVGRAWLNGGTISMTLGAPLGLITADSAGGYSFDSVTGLPNAFGAQPKVVILDGFASIDVASDAILDLSGGGRVDGAGNLELTGRGGNLNLKNEAGYWAPLRNVPGYPPQQTIGGFRIVAVANDTQFYVPLNPEKMTSRVSIDAGSIRAHGFAGGGAFNLTTPEIRFGTGTAEAGTVLPIDFFSSAGFATYTITSNKTDLSPSTFTNGFGGYNAMLATQTLKVGAGETLVLAQSVLPNILGEAEQTALRNLETGGDLRSILAPAVPVDAYDQRAVTLNLNGMLELHVEQGGSIVGAAGSVLNLGGLLNEGTIRIAGGTINQRSIRPLEFSSIDLANRIQPIGIRELSEILSVNEDGTIDPNAFSLYDPTTRNQQLLGDFHAVGSAPPKGRFIYKLGVLDQDQGIVLAEGSVTDLSGAVILNPRAPVVGGRQLAVGRIVAGGTLATGQSQGIAGSTKDYSQGGKLIAEQGARIDLSGVSATLDLPVDSSVPGAGFVPTAVWSDAGTLSVGAGGSISEATIAANAGAPAARGGTLAALNPVFSQHDPADPAQLTGAVAISADLIDRSGFDTMIAYGSMTSSGDAAIKLDRAFLLETPAYRYPLGLSMGGQAALLTPVVSSGGALSIEAQYIALHGVVDQPSVVTTGVADGASVSFKARQIDVIGSVAFDKSVTAATLAASGDIRLIGVTKAWQAPFNNIAAGDPGVGGGLTVQGDLSLIAAQLYPTTGSTFYVTSSAAEGRITIGRVGVAPAIPYSAGGNLIIQAADVVQGGVVRVPFGSLTLGGNAPLRLPANGPVLAPATTSVTLAGGGITSVSAGNLSIPYGTTTDTIEWYFSPTSRDVLSGPPIKSLNLNGVNVTLGEGATVDLSGGGDVYAYEFVPGTGGSRDILTRFNPDEFSGNFIGGTGYLYPDARQVFAIVPGLSDAPAAVFDPIYSADYGSLYSGAGVGTRVWLDAAPGLTAGWYTLLPAQYALLPGGMRVVEQTGAANVQPGTASRLADGTLMVSGRYGDAISGAYQSQMRLFSVQDQKVIRSYSNIVLTSGNGLTIKNAANQGLAAPRTGLDAARLAINPLATLAVDTVVSTAAAQGGRGAQVDIAGERIEIVSAPGGAAADGTIQLAAGDLNNLKAESLLIGGVRTDNSDGTTSLQVTSRSIIVTNDAANPLVAPEIVLVVDDGLTGNVASSIVLADGATITATGEVNDKRAGAYVIDARPPILSYSSSNNYTVYGKATNSAIGALFRVANGPERLVERIRVEGSTTQPNSPAGLPASLTIGDASVTGGAIGLDTSNQVSIASGAKLAGSSVSLGATAIAFTDAPVGDDVVVITPQLQALLSQGDNLTLRAQQSIGFDDGDYAFGGVTFNAPKLVAREGGTIGITADRLTFANVGEAVTTATGDATLALDTGETLVGEGSFALSGFGTVELTADHGLFASGVDGTLDFGAGALTLTTPFIGERAGTAGATAAATSLRLHTSGAVTITAAGTTPLDPAKIAGIPGSKLVIDGGDVSIAGTQVRATAGTLRVTASGAITLSDGARLEAPGFSRTYGDALDPQTAAAAGGTLSLVALGAGGIDLGDATLSVGGAGGNGGTLNLSAANGAVDLAGATLDGRARQGGTGGSFALDTAGTVDLTALNTLVAQQGFTAGLSVRSRTGDLTLAAGQVLRSGAVDLTADGGFVTIAGTIDTSGVDGGDITLFGARGVTLEATAKLDAHAEGYGIDDSRRATGGNVLLGTDFLPGSATVRADGSVTGTSGAISIARGAVVDVSAKRMGNRLVRVMRGGVANYMYVESDQGGIFTLRAPVVGNDVDVTVADGSSVVGARSIELEGFRRWDLQQVAASGLYSGVAYDAATGKITLDVADDLDTANTDGTMTTVAGLNFLGDLGAGTLVDFVQNHDVSGAYGKLGGLASRSGFTARPGIELVHDGDVVLASNWNLGAGVVNVDAAKAAGLMRVDGMSGQTYVVPGQDAALLAGYTRMTYRVGGAVTGAAPVLSLRASGDLELKGSLTDGFFQFRDQHDPTFQGYVNVRAASAPVLQLAAHQYMFGANYVDWATYLSDPNQYFDPECWVTCAGAFVLDSYYGTFPATSQGSYIDELGSAIQDPNAPRAFPMPSVPYNALGNSPAALTADPTRPGDPMANAVVMPLLPGDVAVASSDYRLTAGAALVSIDPLRVDPASAGNLLIDPALPGTLSFTAAMVGSAGGFAVQIQDLYFWSGPLGGQFQGGQSGFEAWIQEQIPGLSSDAAVTLEYLNEVPANLQEFVDDTLAADPAAHVLIWDGPSNYPYDRKQVTMTVALLGAFIERYPTGFASSGGEDGGEPAGPTLSILVAPQTVVRTGTGSIRMAAAGNVDLTGGKPVTWLTPDGAVSPPPTLYQNLAQLGAAAVYTAGRPFASIDETLADPVTGALVNVVAAAPTTTIFTDLSDYRYGLPRQYGLTDPRGIVLADTMRLTGGGDVTISAQGDVTGRRDTFLTGPNLGNIKTVPQLWREVANSPDATTASIKLQMFREGIGALGGGDIRIRNDGSVLDLTLAADTSLITGVAHPAGLEDTRVLVTLGGGNMNIAAGEDVLAARMDAASGTLRVLAGGNIGGMRQFTTFGSGIYSDGDGNFVSFETPLYYDNGSYARFNDATVSLAAGGDILLRGISWLDGFYSPASKLDLLANGDVVVRNSLYLAEGNAPDALFAQGPNYFAIYPGSLAVASLAGDIDLQVQSPPVGATVPSGLWPDAWHQSAAQAILMIPNPQGQLSLLAAGDIVGTRVAMLDADPNFLPGLFTLGGDAHLGLANYPRPSDPYQFYFPAILSPMTDATRTRQHNAATTHAGDAQPIYIYAGGDIGTVENGVTLSLPKQARVTAGRDILNMMFFGQNVSAYDITRIAAGRDIIAVSPLLTSYVAPTPLPTARGNTFILGGPGRLSIEAGRDLGPFLPSTYLTDPYAGNRRYAGGILTVGNDWNPYLAPEGATIDVMFGVGNGVYYEALRDAYLDPANYEAAPDYLFEQITRTVTSGGTVNVISEPDRTKPIYGLKLIDWMKAHARQALIDAYGTADVDVGQAYEAFAALPMLRQRDFLIGEIYFSELRAPAVVDGLSYLKYSRGYTAVNTLFPAEAGYTKNGLEGGVGDPAGIVHTGDLDLRLATIQTLQGGDINILAPGGRVLGGSVVSTAQQAARRYYAGAGLYLGSPSTIPAPITSIPSGFEGVITQRGGDIRTFTDGDFLLNQSRLFTVAGGDITMWSSNSDLNAGQGAKTTANYPPIVIRQDENATSRDDRTGSTTGAGIASFPLPPSVCEAGAECQPDVYLLAPRGTVDAGDAGVRVAGDISVAALRVANADNFQVQGTIAGIVNVQSVNTNALTAASSVASAVTAQAAALAERSRPQPMRELPTILNVRFLGFGPAE